MHDSKMWILGGMNKDLGYHNDVWSSEDGKTWACATNAAPWTARGFFAAVAYDNKIWVMGGKVGAPFLNDVWCSSDGKTWTCATSAAAWPTRQYFDAFVIDNKMWIAGGYGSGLLNDVWYSTDGKTWTSALAAPWPARRNHAAAVFNSKVWISGGNAGLKYLNDIWYADFPNSIQNNGKPVSSVLPVTIKTIHAISSGGPVSIQYVLNKTGLLKIGIYTCAGSEIRTLMNKVKSAGAHSVEWNGCNVGGRTVGAGAYFVRFETSTGDITRKITLTK